MTNLATQPKRSPAPRIAGFAIAETVHRGSVSTLYRATKDSSQVALKVYADSAPLDHPSRPSREVLAQTYIEHDNVARILEHGRLPTGGAYLASEWIDGQPLEQRLRAGHMPPRELIALLRNIAAGLSAVHAAGVVHRDLKPSNIMVRPTGEAVIIDFSCALLLNVERITARGLTLGSAAYMAPEQARSSDIDGRADLYSVGVLAYRAMCEELPFGGATAVDVLRQHASHPITPPLSLKTHQPTPAALSDLCMWLLAKQPNDRVPSAHVLGVTLNVVLQTLSEEANP